MSKFLTVEEFCQHLRIGKTYAYALFKEGRVTPIKLGRKTLVPMEQADALTKSLEIYKSRGDQ
jgi:excisionase family DNA binding protein